jgi:thioredoxin-related protein
MICRLLIATALLLSFSLLPAGARDEPKAKAVKVKDDKAKVARPKVYDEKADAKADIEKALKLAKKDNQRVLIQWGANWCGWCTLLHDRMKKDPKLARELLYEYRVVHVDVGQFNKNVDLSKEYKANLSVGIPYLTVLDADGKVLKNQATDPFETKNADGKEGQNGHDPEKLMAFLKEFEAKPLLAEEVMKQHMEEAAKTDRLVMLHFGAPWCGWCHRLEDWLARPEVAAIMAKEFVDLKIDIDRMPGGKEIMSRYGADKKGIPWFVFLDANGKNLATSDDAEGKNIGFPSESAEIKHFTKMLETSHRKLSKEDIDTLASSLRDQPEARAAAAREAAKKK